jgi:urea transporter
MVMQKLLAGWDDLCKASSAARFADILLRGTGQVMFQNHPLTGLLFMAAIAWGALASGAPEVALGGLLGLLASTLTAMWLRVDAEGLRAGLYGYNGVLVGLALPTFLATTPLLWGFIVLGAAVAVVATLATANVTKTWGVAALTAPFVLVTWLLLMAAHAFAGLGSGALPFSGEVVAIDPVAAQPLRLADFAVGVLKSVSQVFLKDSGWAALLLLAGLAVSSLPAAVFGLGGAVLSVVFAHMLGAESDVITAGLFGFSPVLTAIALGTVFHTPGPKVALYAAVGTLFTVVVQGAMNVALAPFGVPTLTAPFVLVSWLFLLPRQQFEPSGGKP